VFNVFEQLFNPGRQHTEDEHNRLELTRDEEGSSDPSRGPIDLDSGAVVVRAPRRDPDEEESSPQDGDEAQGG
jgi:hypothetical protein